MREDDAGTRTGGGGDAAHYTMPLTVRFQHCDPAGIVFYPRYYEMVNLTIERFFEDRVGASFHTLHLRDGLGVPTVRIETEFRAPSRLEDEITFELTVGSVGRSSVKFTITCRGADSGVRLRTAHTLVAIDMETKSSVRWPDALGARLREIADGG